MIPSNIWWLDFGATTHISNTMRGFLSIQIINPNKNFVLMGNRVKAPIEAIGTYCLFLDTNKHIDLFQTFYVSSLSRNLVSLPKLDIDGYFINLGIKVLLYLKIPLLLVLVLFLMVCTNLTFMMNFLKSFSPCIIVLVLNVA